MCRKKHTKKTSWKSFTQKSSRLWEKKKSNLGIEKYTEKVINETPNRKGLKQMGTDDKKALVTTFNTAYYLARIKDRSAIILNF